MQFDILMPGFFRAPTYYPFAHHLKAPEYRQIVQTVDLLDYTAIMVGEHLGMPHETVPRLGPHWDEALTLMTFIAANSTRLRVDNSVLVLPFHHPLRLAKAIATLDQLSEGRVQISIGAGHTEKEFEAMNVPFKERGAITDEVLDAMVEIWTAPEPDYHGKYFHITGLAVDPRPLQKPRPPIYVGGNSKPALRRAARFDGWQPNPTNWDFSAIPELMDYIRAQDSFAGKEETFDINWLSAPKGVELEDGFAGASATQLRAYRDQLVEAYCGEYAQYGINRTAAHSPIAIASVPEYLDWLQWFSAEVIPQVNR